MLLFHNAFLDKSEPTKHRRKGRNGEIRREDVLEMCETIIRKSSILYELKSISILIFA